MFTLTPLLRQVRPHRSAPPCGRTVECVDIGRLGRSEAPSGVTTIVTWLPVDKKSYASDKINGCAHLGVGTAAVPVSFDIGGKTFQADRVAFVSDYKTWIGLGVEGKTNARVGNGALTRVVRVPVSAWTPDALTLAFALLAANIVKMSVCAPLHEKAVWRSPVGYASNIIAAAYHSDVNALLAKSGLAFRLSAGIITNARVKGGNGGTGGTTAHVDAGTLDSLAAFAPPSAPVPPATPPSASDKGKGKS